MGEMLVVRWPEHSVELRRTFTAMRDLGELLDVTLVTPDGEIEAHRMVLAASSELLRALLRKTATTYGPCSLVFRDLTLGQLELVLDFIYRGELAVDKTQFGLLARACDYLQIKALLNPEEGIAVVDQRVFEDDDTEVVPYHAVTANQGGHVAGSKRRGSHGPAQETPHIEHIDPHALTVPSEFQVIELVEESRPSSSGATGGYGTRRNRQEYAKRAKLTTVGDKKIFSLDEQPPTHGADEKPAKRFCRECSLMFNYLSDYKDHRRQMHSLQCNHCNFRATKSSAVRDHFEKVHQNVRRFSCTECEFQCKDRATLYNHIRRHTNEKPYGCAYCDYKAAQSASMKQHVALHENIESRPHRCDECTRYPISFASRSALTKHKKAHHSGEKSQKQQPSVMNLEIIKDGGSGGDAVSKVDALERSVRASKHPEVEQGGTSVSRATAQATRATLAGLGQDSHRRTRATSGHLEHIGVDVEDQHPEEEMETEEVIDEVVAERTVAPVSATVGAIDEEDHDEGLDEDEIEDDDEGNEEEEEDDDDCDADEEEEIVEDVVAEEEEEPSGGTTVSTTSAAVGRSRRAGSGGAEVRATDHPNVGGRAVMTGTMAGPRRVSDNFAEDQHTVSTISVSHKATMAVAGTGGSGVQQHHPSHQPPQQQQHQQHHHQQQHTQDPHHHISLAGGHAEQTDAIHHVGGQAAVSSSSVIHHPSSVVEAEAIVVPGGSSDSGLSVRTNVASVTMVVGGSHNSGASGVSRAELRASTQHDVVAPTCMPSSAIVDPVVMTPEATIPVHVVGPMVTGVASTTTATVGGQVGSMGIVGSAMDHHTSSSGPSTGVPPTITGCTTQIDVTTKDVTVGAHIVAVHGPDGVQLHPMM